MALAPIAMVPACCETSLLSGYDSPFILKEVWGWAFSCVLYQPGTKPRIGALSYKL